MVYKGRKESTNVEDRRGETYNLSEIVKNKGVLNAGKRGIYTYRIDKTGKRYKDRTLKPGEKIGVLKSYQIFDVKQLNKANETWVLFFDDAKGKFFVFVPKKETGLIELDRRFWVTIETDEQKARANKKKYEKSPIDATTETLKEFSTEKILPLAGLLLIIMFANR